MSSPYPAGRQWTATAAVWAAVFVIVLIVIPALHGRSRAVAIRIFPPTPVAETELSRTYLRNSRSVPSQGPRDGSNATTSFWESVRRVPSCPDPLHN
ncbi:unnamed protein product [Cuscuta europaea]|uniref:Uncharacterized protein n=1 Tax=Cuscuta europaea TaxID=41803 RepID=A0A9P0ZTV0_CUSEU|nr:unnamed protein product [Cuscuta europaea]